MKKLVTIILIFITMNVYSQFPSNVNPLNVIPNKPFSVKGNLSQGQKIDDLSWASSSAVACFPATQNTKFRGNHVLYNMVIPPHAELNITVIPDDKNANFSLYAYQIGTTNYSTVPNLTSCVTCEADHKWDRQKVNQTQDHTRKVYLNSIDGSYNIVIGVVGAEGLTTGGYTLKIDLVADEPLAEQKPLKMYTCKTEKGKVITYNGDLGEGVPIEDLSWASTSSMACFPGTQNEKFRGNHIIYITEMPTYCDLEITVIPEDVNANFSIWAYQVGLTNNSVPPNVSSCIACEADHKWDYQKKGKTQDHTRTVTLNSLYDPYKVVIGVAGAKGVTSGKFKLKITCREVK
jgi:hypothetical protein